MLGSVMPPGVASTCAAEIPLGMGISAAVLELSE